MDHTYGTDLTYFPDGRIIPSSLGTFLSYSSDLAFHQSLGNVNAQLRIRVSDTRFVLSELERLNQEDPDGLLTGRLDLSHVGILGYSFGGAVAMEACHADSRFQAGAALDSLLFGESAKAGVEQPFLYPERRFAGPERDGSWCTRKSETPTRHGRI